MAKSQAESNAERGPSRPEPAGAPRVRSSTHARGRPPVDLELAPAAPVPVPQLTLSPGVTVALEASSRVKRQRVLDVVLPLSTSARMAEAARASVWAISSEKTTNQFEAAEAAADAAEEARTETLVLTGRGGIPEELRRGSRDQFTFLREELDRGDDDDDPHTLWRRAHRRRRHELIPGPTAAEIERLEERIGFDLPPSFWDFSLEWGGGLLYVQEFGTIRVIPALEIMSEVRGPLCNRMVRPYLPVVDLGCGDYLALDLSKESRGGERPIVWWFAGDVKKRVAESFVAWLRRLVELNGQPFWWAP